MTVPSGPDFVSSRLRPLREKWRLPRLLLGGTDALRRASYIPMERGETLQEYEARLNRAVLNNYFRRTIRNMAGKVFSKPIQPTGVPTQFFENIDLLGHDMNVFAKQVFDDGSAFGLSHIFVDAPTAPPGATLAEEQQRGIRPYFVHVPAESVLGYRFGFEGAVPVLTHIRWIEEYIEQDGDYADTSIQQIRVINPGSWEIWRQNNRPDKGWELYDSGSMSLRRIPFVTYYAARTGFMQADVPLEDLAHLNVAHWQSTCDQRHILHFTRMPLLYGRGLSDIEGNVTIGPDRMIRGPSDSDLKYVEHEGAAIQAGRQDLQDLEDQMRLAGLEVLLPSRGNITATGASLDYSDAVSPLQFMALSLQDAINTALAYAAEWVKERNYGEVKVNRDFGISLRDASDVQNLISAWQQGAISRETLWTELKRRGVLFEDFDPTAEAERVDKEQEAKTVREQALSPTGPRDSSGSVRPNNPVGSGGGDRN